MNKIFCKNIQNIPSVEEIVTLTQNSHLVLEFPRIEMADNLRKDFIHNLKKEIPENHSVFYSGSWAKTQSVTITIMPLIEDNDVSKNIGDFIQILNEYIQVTNDLVEQKEEVVTQWLIEEEDDGMHWSFSHYKTKQFLRTYSSKIIDIKAIDPYFLAQFIKTAIGFHKLKNIIKNEFHDTDRWLQFLIEKEITPPLFDAK